jgi:hypothetical protein
MSLQLALAPWSCPTAFCPTAFCPTGKQLPLNVACGGFSILRIRNSWDILISHPVWLVIILKQPFPLLTIKIFIKAQVCFPHSIVNFCILLI